MEDVDIQNYFADEIIDIIVDQNDNNIIEDKLQNQPEIDHKNKTHCFCPRLKMFATT